MAFWEKKFDDHALWSKLRTLKEKIDEVDAPEDDRKRETLSYLMTVTELAVERQSGTPRLQVTDAMLNALSSAVDNATNTIDYWVSGSHTDAQMDVATEGIIGALASWPPLPAENSAKAQIKAAQKVSQVTDEIVATARGKRDALVASVEDLQAQAESIQTAIAAQQALLDSAIATFTSEGETAKTTAMQEWEAEREGQSEKAAGRLETLANLEQQARELVHAGTASVVATDYGRYARNKTIAAWACDVAAAAIGAVGVGAIIFHLYQADSGADGDIVLSLTRLAASLGTLGIAALVAHRGHDHHKEARAAKRTDLAIRQVAPFTAHLPEDAREFIVEEITDRIFIRGELDETEASPPVAGQSFFERLTTRRKEQADRAAAEEAV
jgi:hypothetical protein